MAHVEAPGGQLLVLGELRIGARHLGHLVEFVGSHAGVVGVASAGVDYLHILDAHIGDVVVLKSYDGRGRDVAWVVLGRTLILVSGIGLGAGHLGIYVGDMHIVHTAAAGLVGVVVDLDELMGIATSLAHNEIDGVAGVDGA